MGSRPDLIWRWTRLTFPEFLLLGGLACNPAMDGFLACEERRVRGLRQDALTDQYFGRRAVLEAKASSFLRGLQDAGVDEGPPAILVGDLIEIGIHAGDALGKHGVKLGCDS